MPNDYTDDANGTLKRAIDNGLDDFDRYAEAMRRPGVILTRRQKLKIWLASMPFCVKIHIALIVGIVGLFVFLAVTGIISPLAFVIFVAATFFSYITRR